MGWTSPATWVAGTVVTADDMNTNIRDQFSYLKGIGQVPTIQSGLTIDNSLGSERLLLPLLSTAECTTVLNAEGEVAFDEQTHQMKEYDGTAVRVLISEADVDDTPVNGVTTFPVSSNWAYDLKATLTTRGDVIRRGVADWERLAIGTSGQYLSSNGTDVVWAAGTLTAGCIVIWAGTIANIPAGYVICDGNNSTPNLLARFIEGVATAVTDPGVTGGATQRQLARTGSYMTGYIAAVVNNDPGLSAMGTTGGAGEGASAVCDYIPDIRPLYYDIAFIMKT